MKCDYDAGDVAAVISAFALLLSSFAASVGSLIRACQAHKIIKEVRAHQLEHAANEAPPDFRGAVVRPDIHPG